jgi:hypothetical protein
MTIDVQGKTYEFNYIPVNVYLEARKVLREMTPHFLDMQLVFSDDEHSDESKNAETLTKYLDCWGRFCRIAFKGPDYPLEISLNDADRIVSDFFVSARPGAVKQEK